MTEVYDNDQSLDAAISSAEDIISKGLSTSRHLKIAIALNLRYFRPLLTISRISSGKRAESYRCVGLRWREVDTQFISFLTIDQCNAYIWWYVKAPSCNLITDPEINLRGYVMGQFAKFVRPGAVRLDVSGSSTVAVFKDGSQVIIVDVNSRKSAATHTFNILGTTLTSVTPYVTDDQHKLEALAPISVTDGSFSATVSGNSVTTFVSN